MSSIIRAKKGSWFLGVCKGLEKSNRGNVFFWRLVFFISAFFTFGIPILIYLGLAVIFPIEKSE
ncbi:PspC domain-containing protein [Prochlorococcus sp. AH-716-O10]|nr:PspC domain-containing protein [Prochlorococcus sp. AH-716-O10]